MTKSANSGNIRIKELIYLAICGLAAIGIYGVVSYTVAQRTQEMGLRTALGATRRNILQLVLGQGMIQIGIGLVIGLGGALALTRTMKSLLFSVSASAMLKSGLR